MQGSNPMDYGTGAPLIYPESIQPVEQNSLVNSVFTIDEEVITKLIHFLKGQTYQEKTEGGKVVIEWSQPSDPNKWLVSQEGLRFISHLVSSVVNNATTVSYLTPERIDYEYFKMKWELIVELYRSYKIYLPKDAPTEELIAKYVELVMTVPNYIKFLLHSIRKGRIFDRLTKSITETHAFTHTGEEQVQRKRFIW